MFVAPSASSATTMYSRPPVTSPIPRSGAVIRTRRTQSGSRKKIPIPHPFADLTFGDRSKFECQDEFDSKASNEEDRGPFSVATAFKLLDDAGVENLIALPTLVDHLRHVCKSVGLRNSGSWSKFMCRRQLAQQINNANVAESSLNKRNEGRTNTNCRIVNASFHPDMMEKLRWVNDAKKRSDFEGKTTFKDFWVEISEIVNDVDDANVDIQFIVGTEKDAHLATLEDDVDLSEFNLTTPKSCQQVFSALRRVRQKMKDNMNKSGTHGNDPWDFVAVGLRAVKQSIGFNEAYYYYTRMEEHPEVETQFQPFIDDSLKGDSFEDMSVRQDVVVQKSDKSTAISDGLASLAITNAAMITTLEARNRIASKSAEEDAIMREKDVNMMREKDVNMREKDANMRMYFNCVEALKDTTLPLERRTFMQLVIGNFEARN